MTITKEELAKARELAERVPKLFSYNFEQVNWENGNKSFELNHSKCFISIAEDMFPTNRANARRFAQFYSSANPEFILRLLDAYESQAERLIEADKVIGYYADKNNWYLTASEHSDTRRAIEYFDTETHTKEDGRLEINGGKRARSYITRFKVK